MLGNLLAGSVKTAAKAAAEAVKGPLDMASQITGTESVGASVGLKVSHEVLDQIGKLAASSKKGGWDQSR